MSSDDSIPSNYFAWFSMPETKVKEFVDEAKELIRALSSRIDWGAYPEQEVFIAAEFAVSSGELISHYATRRCAPIGDSGFFIVHDSTEVVCSRSTSPSLPEGTLAQCGVNPIEMGNFKGLIEALREAA